MKYGYKLSTVSNYAAILLVILVTTASAVNLPGPRNNLRLAALFSLRIGEVPRVQILFGGDILQSSLDPQTVTCLCRVQWEKVTTAEGNVEFRPPQDWVSRGCASLFRLVS